MALGVHHFEIWVVDLDTRRVPSLVESAGSWDFAYDGAGVPEGGDGGSLVVVDSYIE